jgi:AraC family transcriptional regulator, positive regulator of tynA and feaB
MMQPCSDFSGLPELGYEEWRVLVRSLCGQYNPEGIEPENFAGWVRPQTICGFEAVDLSCNAHRVERTHRDVRLDSMDFYYAAFQFGGHSAMTQNDHVVELDVGDVVLVDSTRPMTYFGQNRPGRWLALHLPRKALISPSRKSAAVQGASVRLKGRPGLTTPLLQRPSVLYGLVTFGQFSPISADALFAWNGRS